MSLAAQLQDSDLLTGDNARRIRLIELVRAMRSGTFSRNKHFQDYQDQDVQKARRARIRQDSIEALFLADPGLRVRLLATERGGWILELASAKLKARWTAQIETWEWELLRERAIPQLEKHWVEKMADGLAEVHERSEENVEA